MSVDRHEVYRAIEGWAHGFPGLLSHETLFLLATSGGGVALLALAPIPFGAALMLGVLVLAVAFGVTVLLRYRADWRREAMMLMWRARRALHLRRILDDDRTYERYERDA